MKNKTFLLKYSFIITISTIFLLLTLSILLSIKTVNINHIDETKLEKKVQIKGNIINIKSYEGFEIIKIRDNTREIDVFVNSNLNLKINQTIQVLGKIQEYNNNLQIRADKINLLN